MFKKWNTLPRTHRGVWLVLSALLLAQPAPARKPAESHGAPKGEKKPAPAKIDYSARPLGPPLKGFDLSVLRSGKRIETFRIGLEDLKGVTLSEQNPIVRLSLALEFGSESGLAEVARKQTVLPALVSETVGEFTTPELLTTAGKLRLKERLVEVLNGQLTTAQIRQLYFIDFRLLRPD